jgi:hypothetical protein
MINNIEEILKPKYTEIFSYDESFNSLIFILPDDFRNMITKS